jgi:hypothetical protein
MIGFRPWSCRACDGTYGAIGALRDIAEAPGCAAAVMPDAKDLFPEDHPSTPASTVDP